MLACVFVLLLRFGGVLLPYALGVLGVVDILLAVLLPKRLLTGRVFDIRGVDTERVFGESVFAVVQSRAADESEIGKVAKGTVKIAFENSATDVVKVDAVRVGGLVVAFAVENNIGNTFSARRLLRNMYRHDVRVRPRIARMRGNKVADFRKLVPLSGVFVIIDLEFKAIVVVFYEIEKGREIVRRISVRR